MLIDENSEEDVTPNYEEKQKKDGKPDPSANYPTISLPKVRADLDLQKEEERIRMELIKQDRRYKLFQGDIGVDNFVEKRMDSLTEEFEEVRIRNVHTENEVVAKKEPPNQLDPYLILNSQAINTRNLKLYEELISGKYHYLKQEKPIEQDSSQWEDSEGFDLSKKKEKPAEKEIPNWKLMQKGQLAMSH